MAKFTKDNQPAVKGRPKGSPDKLTVFRRQLADLLPEAKEKLAEGIRDGDGKMIELLFRLIWVPNRSSYPPVAVDFDKPRDALTAIKAALRDGSISVDHADALLSALERTARLETAIALADASLVEADPWETVQSVIHAARQTADLDTLTEAVRTTLPYLVPRPEPKPPEPTGVISNEPYDQEELNRQWEAEFCNPDPKTDTE